MLRLPIALQKECEIRRLVPKFAIDSCETFHIAGTALRWVRIAGRKKRPQHNPPEPLEASTVMGGRRGMLRSRKIRQSGMYAFGYNRCLNRSLRVTDRLCFSTPTRGCSSRGFEATIDL